MSIERQNNISSALDRLEQIPEGYHFDQEGTWQKLDRRRHANSRSRKIALWLSAAVLIPVLLLVYWPRMENVPQPTTSGTMNTLPSSSLAKRVDPVSADNASPSAVNAPATVHIQDNQRSGQHVKIAEKKQPTVDLKLSTAFDTPVVAAAVLVPDTASVQITQSKPKPKFPIAHINELNAMREAPRSNESFVIRKPLLATVTAGTGDDKIVQKKKKLPFLPPTYQ